MCVEHAAIETNRTSHSTSNTQTPSATGHDSCIQDRFFPYISVRVSSSLLNIHKVLSCKHACYEALWIGGINSPHLMGVLLCPLSECFQIGWACWQLACQDLKNRSANAPPFCCARNGLKQCALLQFLEPSLLLFLFAACWALQRQSCQLAICWIPDAP